MNSVCINYIFVLQAVGYDMTLAWACLTFLGPLEQNHDPI